MNIVFIVNFQGRFFCLVFFLRTNICELTFTKKHTLCLSAISSQKLGVLVSLIKSNCSQVHFQRLVKDFFIISFVLLYNNTDIVVFTTNNGMYFDFTFTD